MMAAPAVLGIGILGAPLALPILVCPGGAAAVPIVMALLLGLA